MGRRHARATRNGGRRRAGAAPASPQAAKAAHLPPDVRDLVGLCARVPHGLGFLHLAPAESVAVTLGVHAAVVERARAWFEAPGGRALLIDEFVRAARRASAPPPSPPAEPRCDAEALVRRAGRAAPELAFLLEAPLESAAVLFGVHPDVVARAREILARRGRAGEPPA